MYYINYKNSSAINSCTSHWLMLTVTLTTYNDISQPDIDDEPLDVGPLQFLQPFDLLLQGEDDGRGVAPAS